MSCCPPCRSWEHEGGRPGGDPWGSKVKVILMQRQLVEPAEVGLPYPEKGWEDQGPAPYF